MKFVHNNPNLLFLLYLILENNLNAIVKIKFNNLLSYAQHKRANVEFFKANLFPLRGVF